jgi:hypothetical protein
MIFGFFNELYVFKIVEKNKSMFSNCEDKSSGGKEWPQLDGRKVITGKGMAWKAPP